MRMASDISMLPRLVLQVYTALSEGTKVWMINVCLLLVLSLLWYILLAGFDADVIQGIVVPVEALQVRVPDPKHSIFTSVGVFAILSNLESGMATICLPTSALSWSLAAIVLV